MEEITQEEFIKAYANKLKRALARFDPTDHIKWDAANDYFIIDVKLTDIIDLDSLREEVLAMRLEKQNKHL